MATKIQNVIIGAGPAGLQLGYFFQKAGIEYVILEQAARAASFFNNFPHSGKLISINKPNTGSNNAEFNLRHDWNSLLNDEGLLFTDYSKDYYPESADLEDYMNDFGKQNNLNILYNTKVNKVRKNEGGEAGNSGYMLLVENILDGEKSIYDCTKLIVATGLSKMKMPGFISNIKRPILHYGEYEKGYFQDEANLEKYKNKTLLIVGNGNAAFELGNILNPYCSSILILGKKPKEWAMSTHYTGDLRSTYISLYDTFLLKSLNGFDNQPGRFTINQETETSKYTLSYICSDTCETVHHYLEENLGGVDEVIYCTGWGFDNSIFDFTIETAHDGKYPSIDFYYESINNPELYFIGALMHSIDFKRSSGGFIHGFRYLIKHFFNLNYTRQLDLSVIKLTPKLEELVDYILYRINISSALYQMYGQLCDVFFLHPVNKNIAYYNSVCLTTYIYEMPEHYSGTYFFVLKLEYGKKLITNIYELGAKVSSVGTESQSTLLHPVIRVFKDNEDGSKKLVDVIHFDEDIFANYMLQSKYKDKIYRVLRMFIDADGS